MVEKIPVFFMISAASVTFYILHNFVIIWQDKMDAAGVALVIIGPGSVDQVCIMI